MNDQTSQRELVHVVSWRVNGGSVGQRHQQAQVVVAAVEAMRHQIPGLVGLAVGVNEIEHADAWDVGAVMVFRSLADLHAYQEHPAHQSLKTIVGPLRAARSQLDFFVPASSALCRCDRCDRCDGI
jgi:hypothetical protein